MTPPKKISDADLTAMHGSIADVKESHAKHQVVMAQANADSLALLRKYKVPPTHTINLTGEIVPAAPRDGPAAPGIPAHGASTRGPLDPAAHTRRH